MKKTPIRILSFFLVIIVCTVNFSACKKEITFNGVNTELGITVEGGGYDGTATLNASKVIEEINVSEVKDKIKDMIYNSDAPLSIYYISVVKNGEPVLPSGSLKITVPAPRTDFTDYLIFRISETDVEEIIPTEVKNGKITFETSGLFYFVIAENLPEGMHIHKFETYTDLYDGINHKKACACGHTVTEQHIYESGSQKNVCTKCGYTLIDTTYIGVNISIIPSLTYGKFISINGIPYDEKATYRGRFPTGTEITVSVKPQKGYRFDCWNMGGEEVSKKTTFKFTLDSEDVFLIACFSSNKDEDGSINTPIV